MNSYLLHEVQVRIRQCRGEGIAHHAYTAVGIFIFRADGKDRENGGDWEEMNEGLIEVYGVRK